MNDLLYEVTKPENIYKLFKLYESWKEQKHVMNWDGELTWCKKIIHLAKITRGMSSYIFFQRSFVTVVIGTPSCQKLLRWKHTSNFHNHMIALATTLDCHIGQNSITICRFQHPTVHWSLFCCFVHTPCFKIIRLYVTKSCDVLNCVLDLVLALISICSEPH